MHCEATPIKPLPLVQKSVPTAQLKYHHANNPLFFFHSYTSPMASIAKQISKGRAKNDELSPSQKTIISFYQAGETQTNLADRFSVTRKTVYNTIKRWKNNNTTKSLPQKGRPKKFNDRSTRSVFFWRHVVTHSFRGESLVHNLSAIQVDLLVSSDQSGDGCNPEHSG